MMSADNVSPLARSDLLLVLGIGIAMIVILNLIPILFTLVERFFTLTHELGHLIATVLTGGKTKGIRVYYKPHNGAAGEAFGEGGVSPLIYPAGYLGTAIFSAILLLLSGLTSIASYTLLALGLLLILSAFSAGRNFFTRLIGFLFGAGFIWIAWVTTPAWSAFVLILTALMSGLVALAKSSNLAEVVRNSGDDASDDANQMASYFKRWPILNSSIFWVRMWFFLAVLFIGSAFCYTWLRAIPR